MLQILGMILDVLEAMFTFHSMVKYNSGLSFVRPDVWEMCGSVGGSNTSYLCCDSKWT
jgi:hypothetical protein